MLRGNTGGVAVSEAVRSRLAKAWSLKWLGQTVASVCWISSMLAYGINSPGDMLQVCAASAWLLANIATLAAADAD